MRMALHSQGVNLSKSDVCANIILDMKEWKTYFAITIIPLISFVIGITTLNHYGINWDEPYHYRRGQAFLQYISTGQKNYNNISKYPALKGDSDNPNFRNSQEYFEEIQKNPQLSDPAKRRSFYQDDSWNGDFFINIENSYGHPPLNDILAALSNKIFYQHFGIMGDLESYRFFIVALVAFTSMFIAIFVWKEYGVTESIISTLAFCSYPLLVGEQHFNIKDPVEMSFYTLTIICSYLGLKHKKIKWLLLAILFFSFGLSTKFNIVFSLIPISIWFIYHLFTQKDKLSEFVKSIFFKKILILAFIAPIIAGVILILSFPTIWSHPIDGLIQIVNFYLEVGYPANPTQANILLGFVNTFPITWIIYTTPPIILTLLAYSILFVKRLIKKNNFFLLLLVWLTVTIARNSLFGALSYGGVRIIMEFVPAIAVIAGIAAGDIVRRSYGKRYLIFTYLVIFTGFGISICKLITIHPNENVYFNFLIGGLSGARQKNIPYWGDSYGNAYLPAIEWLNKNAEPNAKVSTPIGNTSNIPRFKLRNDIAISPYYLSGLDHNGEYLIELTYNYVPMEWFALKYLNEAMVPVYEVKVDGVPIAKVWKNDPNHVKKEFSNLKNVKASMSVDTKLKVITIETARVENLMELSIKQPTTGCDTLKTGYIETSIDGLNWIREIEDIAREQFNRQEIKSLKSIYKFNFMARKAKFIKIHTDSSHNCLLFGSLPNIKVIQ